MDLLVAEIRTRKVPEIQTSYMRVAETVCCLAKAPCIRRKESARKIIKPIDERLAQFKKSFCEYLLSYIAARGLDEVDVYKRAHLDRRIFSKIRTAVNYMPSKHTVLAIALALELDIDEAQEFLHKGGFALSPNLRTDVVFSYFFENRIYDLFTINEVLYHYGIKPFN